MYTLLLTLTKTDAKLILQQDGEVVTTRAWVESRDMGRQLFEAIEKLLWERGLEPAHIKRFQLATEVSDTFTSVKIAETVVKSFNFAVAQEK